MLSKDGLYVWPVDQSCPSGPLTKRNPDALDEIGGDFVNYRSSGAVLGQTESHECDTSVSGRIEFARRIVLFP